MNDATITKSDMPLSQATVARLREVERYLDGERMRRLRDTETPMSNDERNLLSDAAVYVGVLADIIERGLPAKTANRQPGEEAAIL